MRWRLVVPVLHVQYLLYRELFHVLSNSRYIACFYFYLSSSSVLVSSSSVPGGMLRNTYPLLSALASVSSPTSLGKLSSDSVPPSGVSLVIPSGLGASSVVSLVVSYLLSHDSGITLKLIPSVSQERDVISYVVSSGRSQGQVVCPNLPEYRLSSGFLLPAP